MKCKLCGMEKETKRQMHGHLMHSHYDDYKRGDFVLDRFVDGAPVAAAKKPAAKKEKKQFPRPVGFRFLNPKDPDEKYAIDQGYEFIDQETNIYTAQDAKIEGWI